jgi:hypothetical protein
MCVCVLLCAFALLLVGWHGIAHVLFHGVTSVCAHDHPACLQHRCTCLLSYCALTHCCIVTAWVGWWLHQCDCHSSISILPAEQRHHHQRPRRSPRRLQLCVSQRRDAVGAVGATAHRTHRFDLIDLLRVRGGKVSIANDTRLVIKQATPTGCVHHHMQPYLIPHFINSLDST